MSKMTKLPAGKLTTECRLQKNADVILASGNTARQWTDVDVVWVQVVSLTGAALYYASQQVSAINVYLRMRYREDVRIGMRFVTDTHHYVVLKEPTDVENRHAILTVSCQELQATNP